VEELDVVTALYAGVRGTILQRDVEVGTEATPEARHIRELLHVVQLDTIDLRLVSVEECLDVTDSQPIESWIVGELVRVPAAFRRIVVEDEVVDGLVEEVCRNDPDSAEVILDAEVEVPR